MDINPKAAFFDLDGTLVDSMWMWHSIDVDYLARFGIACPDDLHKKIEGRSFDETAVYFKKRFAIPDPLEKIRDDWNLMAWDKYEHDVTLKPGAAEMLEFLKSRGVRMCVATSNSRELTELVLSARKIDGYFDEIITGGDVERGKPCPDIYLTGARMLGASPGESVVFEDITAGITAAKSAGMYVIAMNDRFSENMRSEKERLSDMFAEDFFEVIDRWLFDENTDCLKK